MFKIRYKSHHDVGNIISKFTENLKFYTYIIFDFFTNYKCFLYFLQIFFCNHSS